MSQTKEQEESSYRSLLHQISQGNESALEDFYRAFESRIFAFIKIRLNDFHEAADILNEVMWEVWRGAERFEGRSSVSSWVFGIANHKILDRIRSKTRHPTEELDETNDYESDIDLEALVNQKQWGHHLHHCMEKLSVPQRQVVHLAFFEDLSYREIGEITGSPEGTIKARMFHAKQGLKRCLSRWIS